MHDVDDLLCTVDEVEHLLDLSKASGPDLVSAHMLKNTAINLLLLIYLYVKVLSLSAGENL